MFGERRKSQASATDVGVAACANLCDDMQRIRVRVERLLDERVGYVRAVDVGGVDVGDSELDYLAQRTEGLVLGQWPSRPLCGRGRVGRRDRRS
jgi:hypothetical protein